MRRVLITGAPRSFIINGSKTFALTQKTKLAKLKIYLLFIFIAYLRLDILLLREGRHGKILIRKSLESLALTVYNLVSN